MRHNENSVVTNPRHVLPIEAIKLIDRVSHGRREKLQSFSLVTAVNLVIRDVFARSSMATLPNHRTSGLSLPCILLSYTMVLQLT